MWSRLRSYVHLTGAESIRGPGSDGWALIKVAKAAAVVIIVIISSVVIAVFIYATLKTTDKIVQMTIEQTVKRILVKSPIIDGHSSLPYNIRRLAFNDLGRVNLSEDLTKHPIWGKDNYSHTDIPRLRKGHVGAQFWVAYAPCSSQYKDAVPQTLEQIDVIHGMINIYSNDLQLATSPDEIESAISKGKIAILVGVEGGHSMQFSFGTLRSLYHLGARYMTLTHQCNTPWADSADDIQTRNVTRQGLSEFGLRVVREMNRLGMIVDLSHVSQRTMEKALTHSKAPVIFSHSSVAALCNHRRNVPDSVLKLVKSTNSLVMVSFYPEFIRCDGQKATLKDVLQHIDHIRNVTGPDYVGIGGDYDGIESVPQGLEDVSKYPDLIRALVETGRWSDTDLEKLTGKNLLRVFRNVEKVLNYREGGAVGTMFLPVFMGGTVTVIVPPRRKLIC